MEVRRTPRELVVTLAREGAAAPGRRGFGHRLLHALADGVDRSTRPNGAQIVLTFRLGAPRRARGRPTRPRAQR